MAWLHNGITLKVGKGWTDDNGINTHIIGHQLGQQKIKSIGV